MHEQVPWIITAGLAAFLIVATLTLATMGVLMALDIRKAWREKD